MSPLGFKTILFWNYSKFNLPVQPLVRMLVGRLVDTSTSGLSYFPKRASKLHFHAPIGVLDSIIIGQTSLYKAMLFTAVSMPKKLRKQI